MTSAGGGSPAGPDTLLDLALPRMARHRLHPVAPGGTPLADVAAAMVGVHAQVPSAAEVSLALRVQGATRSDVRAALWEERSLVRTYGPRGTVHLLAAVDLPWWTAALASIPTRSPHAAGVGLDEEQTDRVVEAIGEALGQDGLTVDELTEALVQRLGPWVGARVMPAFGGHWPRWRQATATAAHRGVLCFGPDRGRRTTYADPRRWAPSTEVFTPEAGARRLAEEWLAAYGPGGPEELAQWVGAPVAWARAALDGALAHAAADTPVGPPSALLLPYFDAYVVGFRPRSLLFPGVAAERALAPSGQAGNYPVLLLDGVVSGVWHSRRSGSGVQVTLETWRDLTHDQRAEIGRCVGRLGEVLEARATWQVADVTVGPHA